MEAMRMVARHTRRRAAIDGNGGSNFAGHFEAAYSLPLPEVKEYILYFLLRKWDRAFIPPGGVGLTAGVVLRCSKVTQIWRRRAPTVERLS